MNQFSQFVPVIIAFVAGAAAASLLNTYREMKRRVEKLEADDKDLRAQLHGKRPSYLVRDGLMDIAATLVPNMENINAALLHNQQQRNLLLKIAKDEEMALRLNADIAAGRYDPNRSMADLEGGK